MTKEISFQKVLSQKSNLKITKEDEITQLINSPDFLEFVQMIEDSLNDGITYNELLSSKEILHKALEILKKKE